MCWPHADDEHAVRRYALMVKDGGNVTSPVHLVSVSLDDASVRSALVVCAPRHQCLSALQFVDASP